MFRVIDETNAIISIANPTRALTVAQKIELARNGLMNRVTKLHVSNWDWAHRLLMMVGTVSRVRFLQYRIDADDRSVNKVVTMKAQVATETPSTSLLCKRDRDLSQIKCYNC